MIFQTTLAVLMAAVPSFVVCHPRAPAHAAAVVAVAPTGVIESSSSSGFNSVTSSSTSIFPPPINSFIASPSAHPLVTFPASTCTPEFHPTLASSVYNSSTIINTRVTSYYLTSVLVTSCPTSVLSSSENSSCDNRGVDGVCLGAVAKATATVCDDRTGVCSAV